MLKIILLLMMSFSTARADVWDWLPPDVQRLIFAEIDLKTTLQMSKVSRKLHAWVQKENLIEKKALWEAHSKGNYVLAQLKSEHLGIIRTLSFSPDGNFFASGGWDGKINLWNKDGTLFKSLRNCYLWYNAVAFSPRFKLDRLLVAGSDCRSIQVIHIDSGQTVFCLFDFDETVRSLAFNQAGDLLASGAEYGKIRIWDFNQKKLLFVLSGHRNSVNSLVFNLEGTHLISASDDLSIRVWDLATQQSIEIPMAHSDFIKELALSPEGKFLASAGWDYRVKIWNLEQKKVVAEIRSEFRPHTVAFSKLGNLVFFGDERGNFNSWDWKKYEILPVIKRRKAHEGPLSTLTLAPDGNTIVTGGNDKAIRVWKINFKGK